MATATLGMTVCEGTGEAIHVLRINWQIGVPAVQSALADWAKATAANQSIVGSHRPLKGRQNQFLSWLIDLAIFRADMAGLKPGVIAKKFAPLMRIAHLSKSKTSAQHLRAACRDTAKRIVKIKNPAILTAIFPE